MTWRELAEKIMRVIPENEMDEQAYVFDYSMNNNPDGYMIPIKDIEPWDYEEEPPSDFSIVFNSEDWK